MGGANGLKEAARLTVAKAEALAKSLPYTG
jgi:hypothetical protein